MELFNDVVSSAILYNIDIPAKMNPYDEYSYFTEPGESHEYLSKIGL